MIGPGARSGHRAQRGQGLLLLLLVMLVAGAAVLLEGIGSRASNRAGADEHTARALAQAKEALIAWAVSHPTLPGRLPYPDRALGDGNFDGVTDCVTSGTQPQHGLGRFPWRGTISALSGCGPTWPLTANLRDGSGQDLWYAVSDRLVFNGNNGGAINIGLLDGVADGNWLTVRDRNGVISDRVAAVIIAPGEATGAQDRSVAINHASYPAQFLDSVVVGGTIYSNADTDGDFILHEPALSDDATTFAFNDRMIYITADELLRAVERRVLGEVAAALWAYQQVYGAYPWLSPFIPPLDGDPAAFDGVPGQRIGHLAYNDATDVGTHAQETGFTISWTEGNAEIVSGTEEITLPGGLTLNTGQLDLIRFNSESDLASGSYSFAMPAAPVAGAPSSCRWQGDLTIADCEATTPQVSAEYGIQLLLLGVPLGNLLPMSREYIFDVAFQGAAPPVLADDAGAQVRDVSSVSPFQNFHLPAPAAPTVSTITVRHSLNIPILLSSITVERHLRITDVSTATVNVDGIYVEPTSTNPVLQRDLVLPPWFYSNQWDRFVLIKYAGNALPGESLAAGTQCTGADCVTLNVRDGSGDIVGVPQSDLHAVVIGAGRSLSGQNRGAGATLADFFEEANASTDLSVERRMVSSSFNDQVRIVEPPTLVPTGFP